MKNLGSAENVSEVLRQIHQQAPDALCCYVAMQSKENTVIS